MVDAIEHVINFVVIIILPLTIILWAIGSRFKDLDEKNYRIGRQDQQT